MILHDLHLDHDRLARFCERWRICEFAVFGSALRSDFRPDSDIDVMVNFEEDAEWSLFDLAAMQEELEEIVGRRVDLVTRRGVEQTRNRQRRDEILATAEVIHVAGS